MDEKDIMQFLSYMSISGNADENDINEDFIAAYMKVIRDLNNSLAVLKNDKEYGELVKALSVL